MHKSVGAIIRDEENRILMIKRAYFPFGWACPAGHIEEGEKPEEALIRETREEVGLEVNDFELLTHEYVEWEKCSRGITGHDWYVYKINDWNGKIEKSEEEVKDIKWMYVSEIEKINLTKIWDYWFKQLKIL